MTGADGRLADATGLSRSASSQQAVSPVPASIPSAETIWRDAYVAVYGCEPSHPVADYQGAYDVIERATSSAVRLPEYGDWFPKVWDEYLHDLVGWQHKSSWAHLPATFRWHEFYDRVASAIEARSDETRSGSVEDESAARASEDAR